MAYPYSVATGNAVIAAAIEWRRHVTIATPAGHPPPPRSTALAAAVDRHLAAVARPHTQGPDIDADQPNAPTGLP